MFDLCVSVGHSVKHCNHIRTIIISPTQIPSVPYSPSSNGVAAYSTYDEPYIHVTALNPPPPGNLSGHYEMDVDNREPYWHPSSMEDELRIQLQKLKVQEIPRENLQWVFLDNPFNLDSTVDNNRRTQN